MSFIRHQKDKFHLKRQLGMSNINQCAVVSYTDIQFIHIKICRWGRGMQFWVRKEITITITASVSLYMEQIVQIAQFTRLM